MGCSLLTDMDGLSGGVVPVPTRDGSTEPPHDDASSDAGPLADAASPVDAAAAGDSAASGDTSLGDGGFCAAHPGHTFCDDFDNETTLPATWILTQQSGTVVLDTAQFTSPPGSLLGSANGNGAPARASAERLFPGSSRVTYAASVMVIGPTNDVEVHAVSFTTKNDPNYVDCYISMDAYSGQWSLGVSCTKTDGGANTTSQAPLGAVAFGTWTPIALVVDVAALTVGVTLGGASGMAALPPTKPDGFTILAGAVYVSGTGGAPRVYADDVLVDVQ
jgi:hypothetical protein